MGCFGGLAALAIAAVVAIGWVFSSALLEPEVFDRRVRRFLRGVLGRS